jgi:hypothetical protein
MAAGHVDDVELFAQRLDLVFFEVEVAQEFVDGWGRWAVRGWGWCEHDGFGGVELVGGSV